MNHKVLLIGTISELLGFFYNIINNFKYLKINLRDRFTTMLKIFGTVMLLLSNLNVQL